MQAAIGEARPGDGRIVRAVDETGKHRELKTELVFLGLDSEGIVPPQSEQLPRDRLQSTMPYE